MKSGGCASPAASNSGAGACRRGRLEVAAEEDADHVVEALAVDGQARVAVLAEGGLGLCERGRGGERHDRRARHHRLAHLGVGELEDAVDELLLLGLDVAALARHVDDVAQLLLGVGRGVAGVGVDAEGADDAPRSRGRARGWGMLKTR